MIRRIIRAKANFEHFVQNNTLILIGSFGLITHSPRT